MMRRRRSSAAALDSNPNTKPFPQHTFYDDKTRAVPPYLHTCGEIATDSDAHVEADAAGGGGATKAVLKRVSSLGIMSRVSSHLPSVSSGLSLVDSGGKQQQSPLPTGASEHHEDSSGASLDNIRSTVAGTDSRQGKSGLGAARFNVDGMPAPSWRLKDRMKTVGVGLVMALNVGTDPPDIVKPHPCAKLQCWMDPTSVPRNKAKDKIGERLEAQYARWQQQRAARSVKYRRALDPTVEDVHALCLWLRRQARHERILFHYNGHGVPRPTLNGEVWVFDKNYKEYIPLPVTDLRKWMGKPSIVILDCSSAGLLIPFFTKPMAETSPSAPPVTPQPSERDMPAETSASYWVKDTILLCPTSKGESLPMHPDYPADIFTSCLTTPIQLALRWFVRKNRLSMGNLNPEAVDAIPGQANDRKTPLGELNWIFTAVTDSIAWNVLPTILFQRLFRQDLLVASMFRNFLLADRILRSLGCSPQSYPPMPPGIADHPLWQAWDLACETCLFGLLRDGILGNHVVPQSTDVKSSTDETGSNGGASPSVPSRSTTPQPLPQVVPPQPAVVANSGNASRIASPISSISSPFFSEQLTAFEIWLEYAERHHDKVSRLQSPEQLPVVLQVLLSQGHRVRALELLRRFLLLGPWAVNLSLSLGIFPYVIKLLQSPEYKSLLVSIWASILKFDPSCQVDLVKDGILSHFIQPLANWGNPQTDPSEAAKQRTLAAFCLAATCDRYPQAQTECLRQNLHGRCIALLVTFSKLEEQYQEQFRLYEQQQASHRGQRQMVCPDPIHLQLLSPTARVWLCVCLGNMIQKCPPAQNEAYQLNMHVCLFTRLHDDNPSVRAAAAFALGCLLEHSKDVSPFTSPSMTSLGPALVSQALPTQTPLPGQPMLVGYQRNTNATKTPVAFTSTAGLSDLPQSNAALSGLPNSANAANTQSPFWPTGLPVQLQQRGGQPPQPTVTNQVSTVPVQFDGPRLHPQGANSELLTGMTALQQLQWQNPQPGAQSSKLSKFPPGFISGRQIPHPGLLGQGPSIQSRDRNLNHEQFLREQPQHSGKLPGTGNASPTPSIPMGQMNQQPMLMNHMSQAGLFPQNFNTTFSPVYDVYQNRRRVELDLSTVETLMKCFSDGSILVRYETLIALSNLVQKYTQVFMVIAERGSSPKIEKKEDSELKASALSDSSKPVVPIPGAVNQLLLDRFAACWHALRNTQRSDTHPRFKAAAEQIIRVVNEEVMDAKIEYQGKARKQEDAEKILSGIAEEDTGLNDQHLASLAPSDRNGLQQDSSVPSSQSVLNEAQHQLVSGQAGAVHNHLTNNYQSSRSMASLSGNSPITSTPVVVKSSKITSFPKSEFFQWKKKAFQPNFDDPACNDVDARDPLNPDGAAAAYREYRNAIVQRRGEKLAQRFQDLKPKPLQHKQKLELLLEDSDGEADEKDAALLTTLKLKENIVLKNGSAKMTSSLLKFHSYEDILMVCDEQDGISVWNYEKGDCILSYRNGSKHRTRMTTSCWINEQSKSYFFVGCNDGSARLWNNIIPENGNILTGLPQLTASFNAVPDIQTNETGSGMVCEWQQFNGTMIASGHSKHIRCWDLHTEKSKSSFEVGTSAAVTTMTTAWDEDLGTMGGGYSGMGPDIIVTGHSNGSLRLFDIRSRNGIAQTGRHIKRKSEFVEHRGWVVNTSFTEYGNQLEVMSGSVSGDIKAWDLRSSSSIRTLEVQRNSMTALSIHKQIPIAATGSPDQVIKLVTLDGEVLQVIRTHKEGTRLGPVVCVEFHKNKFVLAAGATDSLVSIYKPKRAHEFT